MPIRPANYEDGWTLAGTVVRRGIGLHTGESSEVHLLPSQKAGFHVSWLDESTDPITLEPSHVRGSSLCTTLQLGSRKLATVEHLLAALGGCGLSHVDIKVSGQEVPLLDGSALNWIEAIDDVGLVPASSPRKRLLEIEHPLTCSRGNSVIAVTPAKTFTLVAVIDFPQKAIGHQIFSIELTPDRFVKEIAPARTFGFVDQVEQLRASGLIKGATLDNALVCNGEGWINPPLRFPDEPVRHKLLDLIGDLALVGFPQAQVLVYKGSHQLHTDLAVALFNSSF